MVLASGLRLAGAYTPAQVSFVEGTSDQTFGGCEGGKRRADFYPMHTRHCLKIADRIHLLLVRELGQGLDRQRMVQEPLYARDVLLVCDALLQTDAPFLAQHFRRSAACPEEGGAQKGAKTPRALRFLSSIFGTPA
jgi:hypothetical protein